MGSFDAEPFDTLEFGQKLLPPIKETSKDEISGRGSSLARTQNVSSSFKKTMTNEEGSSFYTQLRKSADFNAVGTSSN